jgi:SAM-dependent methyltransferase
VTATLAPTHCAICGMQAGATELYAANLADADFNAAVFSQRRAPDRIHYRMVRCVECGLVRSDPAASADALESLYRASTSFDAEEANLRRTYGRYLRRLQAHGRPAGGRLLEIGCGTGFFLAESQEHGYDATGVEPSRAAATANRAVAERIVNDVMRPGLFPAESFDAVCLFQVFDHVPDPNLLLGACRDVLRPGGLILAVNHDVEALTNRLMRDRSPIIDVEHTYLYSRATMRTIFARNGFEVVEVGRVWNDYSLNYLAHLAPLPGRAKRSLLGLLAKTVGRRSVRVPLGNLYLIGRKPLSST